MKRIEGSPEVLTQAVKRGPKGPSIEGGRKMEL